MTAVHPNLYRLLQQPLECCGNCVCLDPFEDETEEGGACDKGIRLGYVGLFDYCTAWEGSMHDETGAFDLPFPQWSDPIIERLGRGESVGVLGTSYGQRYARTYLYKLVTDGEQRQRLHFFPLDQPDYILGHRLHWWVTAPSTKTHTLSQAMLDALALVQIREEETPAQ